MAEIVIGLACSHSPQLSTGVAVWPEHAQRDRANRALVGTDGVSRDFAEQLERAPAGLAAELTGEAWAAKDARLQAALDRLGSALRDAEADAAVVIGNDHKEMFGDDAMPVFAVYHGDTITDFPLPAARWDAMPEDIKKGQWAYHAQEPEPYPVAGDLAAHLVSELTGAGFDPAGMTAQVPGRIIGHAWTFPRRRLMGEHALPMIPVHLNTLYPPNLPTPARCYAFGVALGEAIRSWPGDERVAVIATGGLSHFVVDEELDRLTLDALTAHDEAALGALPRHRLRSGNSEILNWVVAGGALRGREMSVLDYVPAYRSPAGTGVGMGFALWR